MDISSISQALSSVSSSDTSSSSVSSIDGTEMFQNIYDNLVNNVNSTDSAFQADVVKTAAGEMDNPAQLVIDSSKAQVALQMVTSVRNNALTAYTTIMNMQM